MITRNWVRKAALLIFFIILFFPKAAHAAILRSVITGNSFSVPTLAPLPSFSPVAIEKQNSAVQIVSPFDKSAVDKKASLPVSVHFNADKISVSGPVQQTGYGAPIMAVELLMNGTSYETKQLKPSLKEGTVVFTVSFSSLPVDINQANFQARIYTIYLPSKPPYFLPTNTPTAASTITTVFFQQVVGPQGATVLGPHGDGDVSIIIPPGALAFSIPASISMDIQAWSYAISPSDENAILGVVNVDIGNNKTNLPMDISIPAPPYVTDDDQVLVVRIIKQNGAVKYQLVDLARLINKQLVSQFIAQPFTFPQIFTTGVFGFLIPQQSVGQNANVGYVKGLVTDAKGLPIQGAVVTINTMPEFVSQTNAQGEYVIPTQIGSFSVTAVDPATGNFETSSGAVALKGGGTIVNLQLFQENLPSNTMLTNGSFENRAANWVRSGQSSLFSSLGPLLPQEGTKMLLMTTGSLSVDKTFSTLRQKFVLPANSQKLSFKYDFLTREYPQYVGSEFNDQFEANLLTQKGVIPLASMDVNNPKASFQSINTSFFNEDQSNGTMGHTGWRNVEVNVSSIEGPVVLSFTISDVGDMRFDSGVLLDDIKVTTGTNMQFLSSPLAGITVKNLPINAIFDHNNIADDSTEPFQPNGVAVAYTGEKGQGSVSGTAPCLPNSNKTNNVPQNFQINGHYLAAGNPKNLLCYDGHDGIDFEAKGNVYADAEGIATLNWEVNSYHTIIITHPNGYRSMYLHMNTSPLKNVQGENVGTFTVKKGDLLGTAGGFGPGCFDVVQKIYVGCNTAFPVHLHLGVLNPQGQRVDPYGWTGSGQDPMSQSVKNINLWLD